MAESRWAEICERWSKEGYDALSPQEKVWLNIRSLIDSIENGGIPSYFYNSGAATVADCLANLKILGATEVHAQVARVCGLFPGGVPSHLEERNQVIDSWPTDGEPGEFVAQVLGEADEVLMRLMSDLEGRLAKYLRESGLAA